MSELLKLAERCEQATGPDWQLDFDILCVVDPRAKATGPLGGDRKFTSSIDAAMTLVPEGWPVRDFSQWPAEWSVDLQHPSRPSCGAQGNALTAALALCAAALRARAVFDTQQVKR